MVEATSTAGPGGSALFSVVIIRAEGVGRKVGGTGRTNRRAVVPWKLSKAITS